MTLTGELNGDPGDLPGKYSESIGQYRETLIGFAGISEARKHGREWLTEYSRHADAVSATLSGHCKFFENSHPAKSAEIHEHIMKEMNTVWKFHDILVVDLSLYDAESFREAMSGCTKEVRARIDSQLDLIRRNVTQKLADSVREAWLDLSNKKASSKQQVRSRARALRRLRDVAQGWLTLSEELETAATLWRLEKPA